MNACCLLVLLTFATDPVAPEASPVPPPVRWAPLLPLGQPELGPAPVAASALQPLYQSRSRRGGITGPRRPRFFISAGYHVVEGEHFYDEQGDDAGVSFDFGYMTWSGEMGFALEAGYMGSSFETDVGFFQSDDVDTARYLIGARFIDSPSGSLFAPYLRAGFMYREDEGDVIDDSGSGWYAGGGIDLKFGKTGFSIAPQALYSETDSLNTTEWLLGLTATLAF